MPFPNYNLTVTRKAIPIVSPDTIARVGKFDFDGFNGAELLIRNIGNSSGLGTIFIGNQTSQLWALAVGDVLAIPVGQLDRPWVSSTDTPSPVLAVLEVIES